jgi:hypothetical protein
MIYAYESVWYQHMEYWTYNTKNIPYAQWYRLHDDQTFVMLNFLEYKYPHHTILKIHDKYLQHHIYEPNLLFMLH